MAESKVGRAISAEVPSGSDAPITFDQVLGREIERLNKSRDKRKIAFDAHSDNLTGLAFSGGGIRSATFNLGVLQALAQRGLLRKFDYLSTVSGGGYVGSWLAAFTKRRTDPPEGSTCPAGTFADVQDALSPHKYEADHRSEPPVMHWLRLYSNYLTPHKGIVSGDTWAMLGTWLRNVILNQTILGMMFISMFVLCQSALLPMVRNPNGNGWIPLIAGMAILFWAAISMAINVVQEAPSKAIFQTFFQRVKVTATVMVPFVIACVLLNCGLWFMSNEIVDVPIWQWALGGAFFYFAVWGIVAIMAAVRRLWRRRHEKPIKRMVSIPALLIYSPIAGAVGACLLRAYTLLLNQPQDWDSAEWVIVVFGSGAVMITVLLVGTLHLGLVGRGSMDVVREWWARLGGYLMLITLGWLLLAGTCAFAPLGVRWALYELKGWKSVTAVVLWILHNYFGLKAAMSSKTSGKEVDDPNAKKNSSSNGDEDGSWITKTLKSPAFLNALAKVAPYVFLVGLVLLLATAVHIAVGLVFDPNETIQLWHFNNAGWAVLYGNYWSVIGSPPALWLLSLGAAFFLAGLGLSWRVDVNEFSLHHFYRNRLVRCYLGASNADRKAEPFTGFDPGDDLSMCSFDDNYPGPYPILNAALNITGGEELGYATRRAKSFIFTPLYCGYELGSSGEGLERFTCGNAFLRSYSKTELGRSECGWGKFGSEGGISLGTAMAISGAAASPNMGYHTSPATAFFMALFDVRLGWWMGNPRYPKKWTSTGPGLGLGYLFSEVFANSDQQRGYVYLSDGGHFENLAVYELIRRRCRLIVACDGDADGAYQFSDLMSLTEKARTDFGARIEIKFQDIQPPAGSRECPQTCVVGAIYYDPKDSTDTGTLILVKASMPERTAPPCSSSDRKLPDDVWRYFEQHVTFPHQSTADQWFDELQFESYRALGEYIGCQASGRIGDALDTTLARPKPAQAESMPATTVTV
jgi:hypothetical protein